MQATYNTQVSAGAGRNEDCKTFTSAAVLNLVVPLNRYLNIIGVDQFN